MKSIADLQIKREAGQDDQDYIMSILEYISEDDNVFNELSPESQAWFNNNVDLASEGEDLIPFENTESVPFGDDQDEEDEEIESVDVNDVKVNDIVEITIEGSDSIKGQVIKTLKAALKILTDDEEEIRVSHRKINKIVVISNEEEVKEEVTSKDSNEEVLQEVISKDSNEEVTCKDINEEVLQEVEVSKDILTTCNTINDDRLKEVMYHVSEILRIASGR